jgi:hypothetical protein
MSFSPKPIHALVAYLDSVGARYSVARDCRTGSCEGYHLGRDQIFGPNGRGSSDYSIQHARDKAGLSDARSAVDVQLSRTRMPKLAAHLVAEAKAGRAPDIAEVVGLHTDGRVYDWRRRTGWRRIGPRAKGDQHEGHVHVSYYRDSENRDKVPPFQRYFEPDKPPPPPPEDTVTAEQVKTLQTMLNTLGANLVVDGAYGPATDAALKAANRTATELIVAKSRADRVTAAADTYLTSIAQAVDAFRRVTS